LLFSLLIAVSVFPLAAQAEADDSLWRDCVYSSSNPSRKGIRELWDTNAESDYVIKGPGEFSISWEQCVPAQTLYLEWNHLPGEFSVTEKRKDGSVLKTTQGDTFELDQLYCLSKGASSVVLSSDANMDLCTALIYGPDVVPKNYHPWKPTPKKLDYLVIATHPDDDILFMGAIVPLYGVERGLTGTIVYACSSNIRLRCDEALNGAWAMGLRNYPIFAGFPNILPARREQRENEFSVQKLTLYFADLIRQYRPEVIVTHDKRGEYGHWQHKNVCKAVCDAVPLAADASFDPESAAEFGTFQVKKLYLHLYPENTVQLDVYSPLAAFGSQNVIDIATAAYAEHESQVKANHYSVSNEGFYSLSKFGLYFSAVGPDTGENDLFENIDPQSLSNYVAPTPTASPAPTPVPSLFVVAAPDRTASPAPESGSSETAESSWMLYLLIAMGLAVLAIACALAVLSIRRRKPRG
jgi:LmbE family N-acetylglucosaminyl deacetylase